MDSEVNFIFRNTSFNFRNLLFCKVSEYKGLLIKIVDNSKEVMFVLSNTYFSVNKSLFYFYNLFWSMDVKNRKSRKNGQESFNFLVLLDYTIPDNESPNNRDVSPSYI